MSSDEPHFLELDVHTYDAAASHFEDLWSFYKERNILVKDKKEGIVLEHKNLLGYVAAGDGRKAICVSWDKNHAFILVHFEKEHRDDVVIAVRAMTDLSNKFLVTLVESVPDMVDAKLRREGYPITAVRGLDSNVFHRDFQEFLNAVGTAVFINWLE